MAVHTGNGYREVVSPHARVGDFSELAIIDLGKSYSDKLEDRMEVAMEIREACTKTGFFYIKNHSMPDSVRKGAFEAAVKYFDLPLETKMEKHVNKNTAFYGYTGMYDENTDPTKKGDMHESYDLNYLASADYLEQPKELIEKKLKNGEIWPSEFPTGIAEKDFREPVEAYQREVLRIGRHLIRLFALALNMPEDFFDKQFLVPGLIQRLLRYPPQGEKLQEDHVGIGAHTDYDVLTILAQDDTHAGLHVLNKKGEWIKAPPISGTFVVNICDLMARWTNGVFVSTVHRVINDNQTNRYSLPTFINCSYDTLVEALPTCVSEQNPQIWPPVYAGEYIMSRLHDVYPKAELVWTQNGDIKERETPVHISTPVPVIATV